MILTPGAVNNHAVIRSVMPDREGNFVFMCFQMITDSFFFFFLLMTSFEKAYCKQTQCPCPLFCVLWKCSSGERVERHTCAETRALTRAPKTPVLLDWNWAHHIFPWSIDLINCVSCWDPYHLMQHTPPAARRSDPSLFSWTGPCSLNTEPLRMV